MAKCSNHDVQTESGWENSPDGKRKRPWTTRWCDNCDLYETIYGSWVDN